MYAQGLQRSRLLGNVRFSFLNADSRLVSAQFQSKLDPCACSLVILTVKQRLVSQLLDLYLAQFIESYDRMTVCHLVPKLRKEGPSLAGHCSLWGPLCSPKVCLYAVKEL